MVAGIELGKKYAQVCVRAESFFVPRECGMEDREGMEKLFRKLLKLIRPYGNPENLRSLVFALEENTEKERNFLREMAECYNVSPECLCFMDYKESFCTYLFHQPAELLVHNALLIDNIGGEQRMFLLHRRSGTIPAAAEVYDLSGEKPEDVLAAHAISSVFLLGDFTEEWKEKYLKLLKRGRRVFAGNNLYVKGAYFKGEELSEKKESGYCYLGEEKLQCNIALRGEMIHFCLWRRQEKTGMKQIISLRYFCSAGMSWNLFFFRLMEKCRRK